jgi:hypothetical protein
MYREIKEEELRVTSDSGYVYFIDKNNPLATGNSYRVYYHRHVASIKEGRWLIPSEHVHHIDGNKVNNKPSNLLVLSSSEHTMVHSETLCLEVVCHECNKPFIQNYTVQKYCSRSCSSKSTLKLDSLTREELEYLIWTEPFTKLAVKFNCSDNGIKKWAKRLKCLLPPSRFHTKKFSTDDRLKMYKAALAQLVEH